MDICQECHQHQSQRGVRITNIILSGIRLIASKWCKHSIVHHSKDFISTACSKLSSQLFIQVQEGFDKRKRRPDVWKIQMYLNKIFVQKCFHEDSCLHVGPMQICKQEVMLVCVGKYYNCHVPRFILVFVVYLCVLFFSEGCLQIFLVLAVAGGTHGEAKCQFNPWYRPKDIPVSPGQSPRATCRWSNNHNKNLERWR